MKLNRSESTLRVLNNEDEVLLLTWHSRQLFYLYGEEIGVYTLDFTVNFLANLDEKLAEILEGQPQRHGALLAKVEFGINHNIAVMKIYASPGNHTYQVDVYRVIPRWEERSELVYTFYRDRHIRMVTLYNLAYQIAEIRARNLMYCETCGVTFQADGPNCPYCESDQIEWATYEVVGHKYEDGSLNYAVHAVECEAKVAN